MSELTQKLRFQAGLDADPGWWKAFGLPTVLTDHCAKFRAPRTTARLTAKLAKHVPLPSIAQSVQIPAHILSLDAKRLSKTTTLAGAVWHASRLKWVIESAQRQTIVDSLGADVFAYSLRYGDTDSVQNERIDIGILVDSIRYDGKRCWQAWLSAQTVEIRSRVALIAPPEVATSDNWNNAQRQRAIGVVERILAGGEGLS